MSRDRDKFWDLVEPEYLRATGFCRKLLGNREDGDDLLQDSLVRALTSFNDLKDADSFRPWLYRIIVNCFKNRVKQPWYRRLVPFGEETSPLSDGGRTPLRQAARRRLEMAFRALSPEDRALVTLFELEGWKISELARLTSLTEGNIKVRLSRSRIKMRDALRRYFRQSSEWNINHVVGKEDEICVVTKPGKD